MAGEEGSLRSWAGALQNRLAERRALDRVVTAVRDGGSRVLVVHGEPGVGKSVLLDYLSEQAAGCQVARAIGVQSEMELAFAGLYQLLTPMLERVDDLPVPQRDAPRTVFGMEAGPVRTAYRMLDEMGMEAFAERARRELRATGETIRTHRRGSLGDGTTLTAQEAQVAQLAADGLSNPDIAARLFISVRTVQYHLSKVFSKLGIGSRTELHRVLPGEPDLATER